MWQIIVMVLIVIILGIGVLRGYDKVGNKDKENRSASELAYIETVYKECIADETLDREELKRLLKNLPNSVGKELNIGAMCYAVAYAYSDKVEYVCPICGQKTIYLRGEKKLSPGYWDVFYELENCRRLRKQIKGIEVELDEREFCKMCSNNLDLSKISDSPRIALNVTIYGESTPHRVRGVNQFDMLLLVELTQGKVIFSKVNDAEYLLKSEEKRLKELLGISENE